MHENISKSPITVSKILGLALFVLTLIPIKISALALGHSINSQRPDFFIPEPIPVKVAAEPSKNSFVTEAPALFSNFFDRLQCRLQGHVEKTVNAENNRPLQAQPIYLKFGSAIWTNNDLKNINKARQLWTDLSIGYERCFNSQWLIGARNQWADQKQAAIYGFSTLNDLVSDQASQVALGMGGTLTHKHFSFGAQGEYPFNTAFFWQTGKSDQKKALKSFQCFARIHPFTYSPWSIENKLQGAWTNSDKSASAPLYSNWFSVSYRLSHAFISLGLHWQENGWIPSGIFLQYRLDWRIEQEKKSGSQMVLPNISSNVLPEIPRTVASVFECLPDHAENPTYPNYLRLKVIGNKAHVHDLNNDHFLQNNVDYQWSLISASELITTLGTGRTCSIQPLQDSDRLMCQKIQSTSPSPAVILDEAVISLFSSPRSAASNSDMGTQNRVCYFKDFLLIPASPEESDLQAIEGNAVIVKELEHGFRQAYDMDDIYCVIDPDKQSLELINATPRTIDQPVIQVNDRYFYFDKQILPPFQIFRIDWPEVIENCLYMETNACWKMYNRGFPILPLWTQDRARRMWQNASYDEREQDKTAGYPTKESTQYMSYFFLFYRYLLGRFEVIKNFFETAEEADGSFSTKLLSCPEYQAQVLKYLFTHPGGTSWQVMLPAPDNVTGYASVSVTATNHASIAESFFVSEPTSEVIETFFHEMNHTYGFNHDCGMTYGWSEFLRDLAKKIYPNRLSPESFIKNSESGTLTTELIERSIYFADFLWRDPTTLEIDFYQKAWDELKPIQAFYIFVNDGEVPDALNITQYPDLNREENGLASRQLCYRQESTIEQLNDHRLRVHLKMPFRSHAQSVVFIGSGYPEIPDEHPEEDERFNISLVIPYRGDIEVLEPLEGDKNLENVTSSWVTLAKLDGLVEKRLFQDGGNLGKIGSSSRRSPELEAVNIATKQVFSYQYYKSFNKTMAFEYLQQHGYRDFAVFPFDFKSEQLNDWASNYQYNAALIGRDRKTGEVVIKTSDGKSKAFGTLILAC